MLKAVVPKDRSLLAEAQEPALLFHLLLGVRFPCDETDVEADSDEGRKTDYGQEESE